MQRFSKSPILSITFYNLHELHTEYKVRHSLGKENRTFFRLLNENICTPLWTLASNNNSDMASKIHNSKSGSPQTWDFPEIVLMSMILNAYLFQSNIITDGRVTFQYVQKEQFSLRFWYKFNFSPLENSNALKSILKQHWLIGDWSWHRASKREHEWKSRKKEGDKKVVVGGLMNGKSVFK